MITEFAFVGLVPTRQFIADVQIFLSYGRVVVSEMEASVGTVERRC